MPIAAKIKNEIRISLWRALSQSSIVRRIWRASKLLPTARRDRAMTGREFMMSNRVPRTASDSPLGVNRAKVYQDFWGEVAESVCPFSDDEWNRIVKHSGAPDDRRQEIEVLVAMYRLLNDEPRKTPDARRFLRKFKNATRDMTQLLLTVMASNQVFDAIFRNSDFDTTRLRNLFNEFFKLAILAQGAQHQLKPQEYKSRPVAIEVLVAGVASAWESISGKRFSRSQNVVGPHKYNAMRFLKAVANIADLTLDEKKIDGAARAFITARRSEHI
ncbi:MAG: hypothetical protein U1E67_04795 [Hyphomicrobiales bacterium]